MKPLVEDPKLCKCSECHPEHRKHGFTDGGLGAMHAQTTFCSCCPHGIGMGKSRAIELLREIVRWYNNGARHRTMYHIDETVFQAEEALDYLAGQPNRCKFSESWVGRCKSERQDEMIFCRKHQGQKCVRCSGVAFTDCQETIMGLVCGAPLCRDHKFDHHKDE